MEVPITNHLRKFATPTTVIMVFVGLGCFSCSRPLVAQSPLEKPKFCSVLQPADLTVLLTASKPPDVGGMGAQCMWATSEPISYLKMQVGAPTRDQTAEQAFTTNRANSMKSGAASYTRYESGIGDRAFSWFVPGQATFVVLTKGQLVSFLAFGPSVDV